MAIVSLRLISLLIFLLNLTLISHHGTDAQPIFGKYFCGNGSGSGNTTFRANLEALLLNISFDTTIEYGFYNFSAGEKADKVNVIGLCRGDVSVLDCRMCMTDSRVITLQVCDPNVREAVGWYDYCLLRYSNRSIFGVMEKSPNFRWAAASDAVEKDEFSIVVTQLMNYLRERAASGDSLRKFAAANTTGPSDQTIYGLAQCTPDLSHKDCDSCLSDAIFNLTTGKIGCRVVGPSCYVRYETHSFFDDSAYSNTQPFLPSPWALPVSKQEKRNTSLRIVIAIVVAFVAVLIIVVVIFLKASRRPKNTPKEYHKDEFTADSIQMDFHTIRVATNDFSEANKLGQGGFGPVYLGKLYNGQEIAVKRLSRDSGQGDMEFKNEVLLVAKLHHRNLVRLIGFCLHNKEKLLVYEFVLNKSLDCFIFDPIKRVRLNWEMRYKILEGIARGLLYLHQDSRVRIVHRDLKASNILLDEEMNAKISDFGMARLFKVDQTQDNTNKIVGTYGYMAPEYVTQGNFSTKSDVFSFGVLILEIVSGQKNNQFHDGGNTEHIISAAWKNWQKGTLLNIVDPTLVEDVGSRNEIMRCIHMGLLCVQENADDRPTMASIVPMLTTYSITLPVPSEPLFYIWRSLPGIKYSSSSGDQFDKGSTNELSLSEQYPR